MMLNNSLIEHKMSVQAVGVEDNSKAHKDYMAPLSSNSYRAATEVGAEYLALCHQLSQGLPSALVVLPCFAVIPQCRQLWSLHHSPVVLTPACCCSLLGFSLAGLSLIDKSKRAIKKEKLSPMKQKPWLAQGPGILLTGLQGIICSWQRLGRQQR